MIEKQNTSKAASQLGITQAGASALLKKFRNRFGDELFIRTKKRDNSNRESPFTTHKIKA
ncbi:MAG: LysR family transcriptional regulator [Pseudomonadales bacterium]|nr:LysR family transcriptional regulator [Pseudomonadales bacterium]